MKIPKVIETYVKASNQSDSDLFVTCFTKTATVFDEGETRTGQNEIKKWFQKTRSQYKFQTEPVELKEKDDIITLKAKISGTFPGSPVTLSYRFQMHGGLIQDLSIG